MKCPNVFVTVLLVSLYEASYFYDLANIKNTEDLTDSAQIEIINNKSIPVNNFAPQI